MTKSGPMPTLSNDPDIESYDYYAVFSQPT